MIDRLIAAAGRLDDDELAALVATAETFAADDEPSTPAVAEIQPTLEPASIDNTAPVVSNTVASSSEVEGTATVPPAPAAAAEVDAEPGAAVPEPVGPADGSGLDATYADAAHYAGVVSAAVGLLEQALAILRDAGDDDGEEDTDAPS